MTIKIIIINEHIGIRQFFTRQNFPNPDSSKFSTVKILRHTVARYGVTVRIMRRFYSIIILMAAQNLNNAQNNC